MELGIIIGIGIAAFLFLYFAFQLDKEHFILKLLSIIFFVITIYLLPKAAIDYEDNCQIVIANETLSGNTTTYEHEWFCDENEKDTANIFNKIINWFIRMFYTYLVVYFLYWVWKGIKLKK